MDIQFPLKGLDTNSPQNALPEEASADLLNVMPFDRDSIMRGAVRPGVSKFASTLMGSGAPVLLLAQETTALDPSTIAVSTQLLAATFVAADGTGVGTLSGGSTWHCTSGGASFFPFTTLSSTAQKVKTNTAVSFAAGGGSASSAVYIPVLTLGPAYIVEAVVHIVTGNSNLNVADSYGLMVRLDTSTYPQDGFVFWVNSFGCQIRNATGGTASAEFDFGTALSTGNHTIQIRVNGNVMTGWVDGVHYVTLTSATNNTHSGVGFWVGSSHDSSTTGVTNFNVYTGAPLASYRQTTVIAVSGGNIYEGDASGFVLAGGGTGVLSQTIKPQMAQFSGICYFVDGVDTMKTLNIETNTVAAISPSAGLDTATTLGAYTLACSWHGRLVLAASAAYPMNFVMSRQNNPLDWDYSQTDVAAAVAGNASSAGALGDPLNCLMPWTDDVLILGGDHTIHKVEGDIAAGGQILSVSDAVGTLGADAWDVDPNGNLFFAGTGGIYRMAAGGTTLLNISDAMVRQFFTNINRVESYVLLTWDRDRNGLHIHVTPANTGVATHLFWDATTQGFFPMRFPNSFGPISAAVFDGDGPNDRQLLLGCRDGYVRKIDPLVLDDDGTDITSYVFIGPIRPSGDAALSVLEAVEIILGDPPAGFTQDQFGLTISTYVGTDAYRALLFPDKIVSFTIDKLVARRKRRLQRILGGTFFFKFSGIPGRMWSVEKLVALFTEGGLQRRYASVQD